MYPAFAKVNVTGAGAIPRLFGANGNESAVLVTVTPYFAASWETVPTVSRVVPVTLQVSTHTRPVAARICSVERHPRWTAAPLARANCVVTSRRAERTASCLTAVFIFGNANAAAIPMMTITTSSSTTVNPGLRTRRAPQENRGARCLALRARIAPYY